MRKWLLTTSSATAIAIALTMAPIMPAPQAGAGSGAPMVLTPDTTADKDAPESALTLREAFNDAQTIAADSPSMVTIRLSPGATYELDDCGSGALHHWNNTGALMVLDGRGATIHQKCWAKSVMYLGGLGGPADYWLSDVTITGGTGRDGGGIVFSGSNLFLNRASIWDNQTGGRGGGIHAYGDVHLIRSTLYANTAHSKGGGIYSGSGAVNIDRSSVVANRTTGPLGVSSIDSGGGGVYSKGATTVSRSTISWNRARVGAGVLAEGDTSISDSTLDHNSAERMGGAVFNADLTNPLDRAEFSIRNTTVSRNAADVGGGVYTAADVQIHSTTFNENAGYEAGAHFVGMSNVFDLMATNSVFGPTIAGSSCSYGVSYPDLAGSGNFEADNSCGLDPVLNVVDGGDPGLGLLTDNGGSTETHLPEPGSAVVDQPLADAGCLPRDQRGISRPRGRHCDIGAVER